MIYVFIGIVILVLVSVGCSLFKSEKDPSEYLERKYPNIKFTLVEKYDSGDNWSKYHFKSERSEDVAVSCNKTIMQLIIKIK